MSLNLESHFPMMRIVCYRSPHYTSILVHQRNYLRFCIYMNFNQCVQILFAECDCELLCKLQHFWGNSIHRSLPLSPPHLMHLFISAISGAHWRANHKARWVSLVKQWPLVLAIWVAFNPIPQASKRWKISFNKCMPFHEFYSVIVDWKISKLFFGSS